LYWIGSVASSISIVTSDFKATTIVFFTLMLLRLRKMLGSRTLVHCSRSSKNYFFMGMLSRVKLSEKIAGTFGWRARASFLNC
jgi:hypothetical protein